jgi:DNA polymerase-3 subunit gamma/tau
VVFVLATTDPQRVLATILSRCQRFDFRRIPLQALEQHLSWIADQEQIGITPEALHVVAQRAQGGLRDAESLLDQLSLLPAPIEATAVWELLGAVPEQELLALAGALASCDPLALLEGCRELLERGREPAAVLQGLVSLLRDLVLAGTAPDRLELTSVSPQFRQALPDLARSLGKARLLQWQAQLRGSEQQLRHSVNPRLWLEVLLLGLLAEPVAAAQPISAAAPAVAPVVAPPIAPAVTPAVAPIPAPAPVSVEPNSSANLPELWQQILAGLELPSTRMLLSQQARLVRLDERRAVVQVAGNWMAMVQSRLPLLEAAVAKALGSPRQLTLEGGGESAAPTGGAPSATTPSAAIASATPRPTPPPPTPEPLANPAPLPSPAPLPNPAADPPAAAAIAPPLAAPLDDKARRLAEFFNGEVVELDGPLDELTGDALTCDAEEAAA